MADASSLVLFIRNTGAFYPSLVASERRLALKKVRGVYDRNRADSEFAYIVEEGAKRYVKELGESEELPSVWHVAFPKGERALAASELVDYFETHYRNNPEDFEKTLPKKYQGGKHAQTQLSEDDLRARRKGAFSLAQLEALPTINEGHTSDLKWDTGQTRVWLSRMTKEDGQPYDNQVIVETRQSATSKSPLWKTILKYPAKGRPLSQFLLPRLEAEAAYFRAQRMFPGKHVAIGKSEHPGQAMLQSTQLTRNQLLKTLKVQHDSAASLRRAMAKVKKHESGGNPKVDRSRSMGPGFLEPGLGGDLRYSYVPLSTLSHHDQVRARAAYPHKRVGAKYDFRDEHYYYPVKADGSLARAARNLAIPLAWIKDAAKMRSLGYAAPNPAWHESGGNPRVKKHPLDAAAVRRIDRAAAKSVPSRKRAPFTGAQRKQRGLAPLDAGLKSRIDKVLGKK